MISVIIPTYNEEEVIGETIQRIKEFDEKNLVKEIIVVDGGSTDNTVEIAKREGAKAFTSPAKGRGAQMNYGASVSENKILYFLHADTIPPRIFSAEIESEIAKGFSSGCYRLSFDHDSLVSKSQLLVYTF